MKEFVDSFLLYSLWERSVGNVYPYIASGMEFGAKGLR
jgi:hypothetical protein